MPKRKPTIGILAAIGQVVVSWGPVEELTHRLLWRAQNETDDDAARSATGKMTLEARMLATSKALALRSPAKEMEFAWLCDEIAALAAERHRIIHGTWLAVDGGIMLIYRERPRVQRLFGEAFAAKELNEIASRMDAVARAARRLIASL